MYINTYQITNTISYFNQIKFQTHIIKNYVPSEDLFHRIINQTKVNTGVRIKEVFCERGNIVLFMFPAVGRLFNIAGFTLYYVPLN